MNVVLAIVIVLGALLGISLINSWLTAIQNKRKWDRMQEKHERELAYKIKNGIYDIKVKVNDSLFMVNVGSTLENLQGGKCFYNGKTGFLNANEKYLVPLIYDSAFAYNDSFGGLIEVSKKGEGSGIVNDEGIEVLPCRYKLEHLNCGLWIVEEKEKMGIANEKGVLVTSIKYDKLCFGLYYKSDSINIDDVEGNSISISCFGAQLNNKVGLVAIEGREVIQIKYDKLVLLNSCFIIASLNDEYALFDPKGDMLIPFSKNGIKKLTNHLIAVEQNGKYRVATKEGRFVSHVLYDDVTTNNYYKQYVNVCINHKWGLYSCFFSKEHYNIDDWELLLTNKDEDWTEKIPIKYDEIGEAAEIGIVAVRLGEKYGAVDYCNRCLANFEYDNFTSARDAGIGTYNLEWKKFLSGKPCLFNNDEEKEQSGDKSTPLSISDVCTPLSNENELLDIQEPHAREGVKLVYNYDAEEWIQKRNEILKRDNYTCQCCQCFNPSLDTVVVDKQNYVEIHSYDKYTGEYHIANSMYNIGVSINLGYGKKIVMPILNVHHKRYVNGRELWEYDDEDLITLCQYCHQHLHSNKNVEVPIMRELNDGNFKKVGVCALKDMPKHNVDCNQIETFTPWSVVEKCNGKYRLVEEISPSYRAFIQEKTGYTDSQIEEIISKMGNDFIHNYLKFYQK